MHITMKTSNVAKIERNPICKTGDICSAMVLIAACCIPQIKQIIIIIKVALILMLSLVSDIYLSDLYLLICSSLGLNYTS